VASGQMNVATSRGAPRWQCRDRKVAARWIEGTIENRREMPRFHPLVLQALLHRFNWPLATGHWPLLGCGYAALRLCGEYLYE